MQKKMMAIGFAVLWAFVFTATAATLQVDFTFDRDAVELIPAGEYTRIGLAEGTRVVDEVGAPAIPAKFANILIPSGARNISVSSEGLAEVLAEDIVPYPSQPRRPKSKSRAMFVPQNNRYSSNELWPADIASGQGDHDMQGFQFVSVRVNPLAYNGAEKKLYFREKVTVTVSYELAAAKSVSAKQAGMFGDLVNSLVVNPAASAEFAPVANKVAPKAALDYLIITSGALSNAFQNIANYRASAAGGSYSTRVLTTNDIGASYTGTDIQAKIRACISNSVATLGTTMVLLGGDDTVVAVRKTSVSVPSDSTFETEMPTDLYYSGLSGSWNASGNAIFGEVNDQVDMAWDVAVGRLPIRTTTQVTNYLDKVIAYESGNPVTNKIILGGPLAWDTYSNNNRPSDDVTGDGHAGFRSTSPAHTQVSDSEAWLRRLYRDGIRSLWPATVGIICDTLTSWDTGACGSYAQNAANTLTSFNRNWTHLMFSGHGSTQLWGLESGSFANANATSMTGLTAFVYTDACLTGHFDKDSNLIDGDSYTTEPCLGESFLRNTRPLGGALAYMGCARYGWGEPDSAPADNTARGGPSTEYAYCFYQRMYEVPNRTLGVAFAMHKADMISFSAANDCERWIQFGMNLLGDPALKMPAKADVPTAPTFVGGTSFNATANVASTFEVVANGSPTPALVLRSTTASAGYTFTAGSGVLSYTPPASDIGTKTFAFTASNSLGVATQVVSATVSAGPPLAPDAIWASATNNANFTAAWSPSVSAINYRLDVANNDRFSSGGASGVLIQEGFSSAPATPAGWTFVNLGTPYTSTGNFGASSPSLKFDTTGDAVLTPFLSSPTNVSFWLKGQTSTGSSLLLESASGGVWSSVTNITTLLNTAATYSCPLSTTVTNLRFTYTKVNSNLAFDDVVVKSSAGGSGFVPGYENLTVAGTSQSVTGLTVGSTYYFRARAVNGSGTSPDSPTASVTTTVADSPPVFVVVAEQAASVGVPFTLNLASYVSGSPTPAVTLQSSTAQAADYSFTGTTLSFTPSAMGTFQFTFRATNTLGTATQVVAVAVSAAPVLIPTVSIADIAKNSFTANWTAIAGGTTYQLQVATNASFSAGGSGAKETITSTPNTSLSEGWSHVNGTTMSGSGSSAYHSLVSATKPGVVSPAFSTIGFTGISADYSVATYGGAGANVLTISYSTDNGTTWVPFASNNKASNATYVTGQSDALPSGALGQASVRIKWHCDVATAGLGIRLQSLVVSGTQPAGDSSIIVDQTVSALSYGVTSLTPETTYFVRARGTGGTWSSTVSATTLPDGPPVPVAPAFNALGAQSATVGVALNFTVSATGTPKPTLALQSATVSAGYSFTAATGALTYTPAAGDVGAKSFTFTASNDSGTATQVVSVVVAAAPVLIPTVSIANLANTSFTANWTAITGGTTYQLQVAADELFTAKTAAKEVLLSEAFTTATATTVPNGWVSSANSDLIYGSSPYFGAAANSYKFKTTGQSITSPTFAAGATNLQFWSYGNGTGAASTYSISGLVNSVWTLIETVSIATNAKTYNVTLPAQVTQLKFLFTRNNYNCALDDIVVSGVSGPIGGGSIIVDQTVSALSYGVTSLTPETTYFVRARGTGGTWSPTVSATTASSGNPEPTPEPEPITFVMQVTGGTATPMVEIPSVVGVDYALEFTTNLVANPVVWETADEEKGTGHVLILKDDDPADHQRIYRVVRP